MSTTATGYWCTRGGLFVLVHAATADEARAKASRAMNRSKVGVRVRKAKAGDRVLWAELLEQQAGGAEGCRSDRADSEQASLFAA